MGQRISSHTIPVNFKCLLVRITCGIVHPLKTIKKEEKKEAKVEQATKPISKFILIKKKDKIGHESHLIH